jgi:hypothetical protein
MVDFRDVTSGVIKLLTILAFIGILGFYRANFAGFTVSATPLALDPSFVEAGRMGFAVTSLAAFHSGFVGAGHPEVAEKAGSLWDFAGFGLC